MNTSDPVRWDPPQAAVVPSIQASRSRSSGLGRFVAVLGTLIASAPVVGCAVFLWNMILAFLRHSDLGTNDARAIARDIGQSMIPLVLGLSVGMWGLLLCFLALVASSYRERWFFWSNLVLSIVHLAMVPIGTMIAIANLAALVAKRGEFFPWSTASGSGV